MQRNDSSMMPDCDHVMQRLWSSRDNELSLDDAEIIEAHVATCARCQQPAEFERAFLSGMRSAHREHPDPLGLLRRIRAVIGLESPSLEAHSG